MRDHRLTKWAELLVNYSLGVTPGQKVLIQGDIEALPLIESCYEECLKAQAHPDYLILNDRIQEYFLRNANETQLSQSSLLKRYAVDEFDAFLFIYAPGNLQATATLSNARQAQISKANQPIMKMIMDRTALGEIKWCRTHYPTAAAAQMASMGTEEFEDFVFKAGFLNLDDPIAKWKQLGAKHKRAIDYLSKKHELHFINGRGTNLKVNVSGMHWVNLCGTINFPDGEIYTGPNLFAADGGVNGRVIYDFPTVYKGVEVDGIELTFEKGCVTHAQANKNESFLLEMIAQDPGAKCVGEIAIGTNYGITHGVKDILFDEKIGGTFHTALGMGYPQTGNTNQSALHWDLVCDLRLDGTIFADGEKIYEKGHFLANVPFEADN